MRTELWIVLIAAWATGSARAATLHVHPSDEGSYRDVASAIEAADTGDTIQIATGRWPVSVAMSKSLDFVGVSAVRTILDGEGTNRIFLIEGDVEVTFRGIRFDNGFHEGAGGALMVRRGAVVTVEECRFHGNVSDYDGGAAHVRNPGSRLRLARSYFEANRAVHNSGAVNAVLGGRLEIVACGFLDNTSELVSGAIAVNNGVLDVTRSVFRRNEAVHVGAIHVVESWASITNCTFDMNAGDVATVLANTSSTVTVERNIFNDEQRGVGFEIRRAASVVHGCNVYWSNAKGPITGDPLGVDSLRADPRFCSADPHEPELTLWAMSPAAPAFSACGELIGAYPVTCRLPTDAPSTAHWDPLNPRER